MTVEVSLVWVVKGGGGGWSCKWTNVRTRVCVGPLMKTLKRERQVGLTLDNGKEGEIRYKDG